MAVTKIWAVRGRIVQPIDYAMNPEKTDKTLWNESKEKTPDANLTEVLNYAVNSDKTEKQYYVSGINCEPESAAEEFDLIKRQFQKEGGIICYHAYQSFKEGELMLKITGNAAKETAILIAAALKAEQKTAGKSKLSAMLKSGKELTVFSLPQRDLKKFVQEAKKYGVLYCTIKEKGRYDENTPIDIITRAEDAPKINRLVERFKLAAVDATLIPKDMEKSDKETETQSVPKKMPDREKRLSGQYLKTQKAGDISENAKPSEKQNAEKRSKASVKKELKRLADEQNTILSVEDKTAIEKNIAAKVMRGR